MSDGYVLQEESGSIDVTAGALAQIVQRAVESVEGARVRRRRRGLDLRLDDGRVRARDRLGAARGGDQRGDRAGEAVRDRGRGAAGQRHPRADRPGAGLVSEAEQALERAEALVRRLEEARRRLETTEDAEAATEVLSELAEIAREIETELAEARRRAEEDAREEP